ncbi:hypothetical protein Zmor_003368 [Zophobas morio]|uniref:Uncharacterized protein n=1 Tax=Zophobas morio TaxID=2755281 RepID=A0AA38HMQ3_9CUCU|nr:hypothetical protein Zmor_003368 [Zophobas morio]
MTHHLRALHHDSPLSPLLPLAATRAYRAALPLISPPPLISELTETINNSNAINSIAKSNAPSFKCKDAALDRPSLITPHTEPRRDVSIRPMGHESPLREDHLLRSKIPFEGRE